MANLSRNLHLVCVGSRAICPRWDAVTCSATSKARAQILIELSDSSEATR